MKLETETIVTIKLTLREARLLKCMMQYPHCPPEVEDEDIAKLRAALFEDLSHAVQPPF